jgi:general stress protein 26
MPHHEKKESNVHVLAEKIKDIRFAMMTTAEPDGSLHSRPMATLDMEFNGDLWFFTQASTPKVQDVQRDEQVNLSYTKPEDNLFISISGTAQLVHDEKKMKDYWKPYLKAWFPKGLEDPDLALLRVSVDSAEFWESPAGTIGRIYSAVKGLATGGKDMGGENEKLDIK